MLDFLWISTKRTRNGVLEVYPKFIIKKSSDLMIRGRDFYAIWVEEKGLWSTDEQDAIALIDRELDIYAEQLREKEDCPIQVLHMRDSEAGVFDHWLKYCQKHMRDSFHMLDEKLIFSNTETRKEDYASRRLPYPLSPGDTSAYDKLMSTLYSDEERHKIEWAIGSIVNGDSKEIQKFMVLYGAAGTGKSTVLNIIQSLFDGYYSVFDAKSLGSSNAAFALEAFRSNPLVAIQHDGDLSKIEDNTRLNSLVSHEVMVVNEKFKAQYETRFKCFLFMGTNKPVKITDAKSGLIRRLIDVTPTGNKLSVTDYKATVGKIKFELGAIAEHCKEVYEADPGYYDNYIPIAMLGASNDFYNFVADSFLVFKKEDGTTLKSAWEMYKTYCDEAKVGYPFSQRVFKEELKNYFHEYKERFGMDDGSRVRSYYKGFRADRFEMPADEKSPAGKPSIIFLEQASVFDLACFECPAQYASDSGTPLKKWSSVDTKLGSIDTSKLHYVKVPTNHIVIDFDIPNELGEKDFARNLDAASKWPPTYAELSKSGAGIHLHYIYDGDVSKLSRVYDDHIEVKIFTGNSSLRRKLTKCNNLQIAHISSGLPLKEEKMVNQETVKSERGLRSLIKRNLNKEIHPSTKPSVDFIFKILEDAYENGLKYDVSDMRNAVLALAASSTHQSDYCIKLVNKMRFKSDEPSESWRPPERSLVFFDCEVFPNLFLVNWKFDGIGNPVFRMINPTPEEIEELLQNRLVGFNCRRYDNHILYARLMGYTNEQLYNLSQKIVSGDRNAFFSEAYNLSYTDIYDFASAGNKMSLKKLEIAMGITHKELGMRWDEPVPPKLWERVAEYCDNDVIATEAAFHYLKADWTAREILADLANMTVNDTTNSLTQRIIFGMERNPQSSFNYRNLAEPVTELTPTTINFLTEACPEMMAQKHGEANSLLPYFEGYKYEAGVSTYRGEVVGEGGYVYAEPGIYGNVALLDISSMHPHSIIAECLFGVKYTTTFRDIVEGRVAIKHEDWNAVEGAMDGKLAPYIQKAKDGEMSSKDLANALKTAINSVYGLTSANFDNPFHDIRNKDNIVAKRGALFMIDLKHEVQARGFKVAHIKTDSIKIPDATPEIIQFVMDFGKRYGYSFEHEETYDRMCLVNDAVYIAKYKVPHKDKVTGKDIWWTATGTQFQVPYVFKTLFSHAPIHFEDLCETKSVTSGALYLDMNESLPDPDPMFEDLDKAWNSKAPNALEKVAKRYNLPFESLKEVYEELKAKNEESHNYIFVGRVGQFTPVIKGSGGGVLLREKDGKYYAVTGTKGYRWKLSEVVKELGLEDKVDKSYYVKLVDDAVKAISEHGDFEWFVSDDPYIPPVYHNGKPAYTDTVPWDD